MSVAEAPRKPSSPTTSTTFPASSRETLDRAVEDLAAAKGMWVRVSIEERLMLLEHILEDFAAVDHEWVEACRRAEGTQEQPEFGGEEWLAGPYVVTRNIRLLKRALREIRHQGVPRAPGGVTTLPGGQVAAHVFPVDLFDKAFFPGVTAEVWMEPGVSAEELPATQALAYRGEPGPGRVALVLGAGNVSSIGPMDALYKLFVENQVVLYKTHPVNEYLGPVLERGFASMVERDFFRLVYGGADVGAYLVDHPGVDEIHITGSDRTVEAIVFGPGEEGQQRKRERKPRMTKPISSELGNVSPVIVVPGPWSAADITYQAENIASMLTNNAGFNCNAARVLIQHAEWADRGELLDALRATLARAPVRDAYYPGAEERFERFLAEHPEAERFGERRDHRLPWALIPGLDPGNGGDVCFRQEAFCSLFGETALTAADTLEFLERAVAFANETLWGTLNATLIVHPASLKDPAVAEAVERAVAELRYGTVSLNHWAAVGYALGTSTWGAFPGHDIYDIQSGTGVVHNTLMFSRAQKTVVRSPFRAWPKPPWFVSHQTAHELCHQLAQFEADRSLLRLPAISWLALRG